MQCFPSHGQAGAPQKGQIPLPNNSAEQRTKENVISTGRPSTPILPVRPALFTVPSPAHGGTWIQLVLKEDATNIIAGQVSLGLTAF